VVRKLSLTVVALLAFAAAVSAGTLALFTDQATVGANLFSTSTIDIDAAPASAVVTLTGMLPGDSVTDDMTVTNAAGSAALRYAISSTATDADGKGLKDALVLTIRTADVTTPDTPCDDFDGSELYSGDLDATASRLVGDATAGSQGGDRSLAVDAAEVLCFRVALPLDATGPTSASTTATFTFDAEQTANNP
jgi:predicted ribosomally synthesized peptide with SipW-like signal peptide